MSQKWKITFTYSTGPVPKGQVVYVTTESNVRRPTEDEIRDSLRAVGIETDRPWTGIAGSYRVDFG